MNWKATIAFLLLAAPAFAQTATPTNTPTSTPTATSTNTPTPAPTNTPLPTSTPVNPFTTDYLTINKLTGILYGNGTSPVTSITFTPAATPTNTPTNTPTGTATPTNTPTGTPNPWVIAANTANPTPNTWLFQTPTPRATDTPAAAAATATPLVFGTPGVIPIFAATELGAYAGSSTCTAGSLVVSISPAGAVTCATPVPVATATPIPAVATATPRATDTPASTPTPENPFGNLSYSGKLNVTGGPSISANATPAAGDRAVYCSSSGGSVTYTMPAATGTHRVIDMWKVDSGNSCIMSRAGSDTLNGATTLTLSTQYNHETCIDHTSTVWLCTGDGT